MFPHYLLKTLLIFLYPLSPNTVVRMSHLGFSPYFLSIGPGIAHLHDVSFDWVKEVESGLQEHRTAHLVKIVYMVEN